MKRLCTGRVALATLGAAALLSLSSCRGKGKATGEWLTENDVRVAVDNTFELVLAEMAQTFGMAHIEAKMKPMYLSEDSAIRLLVDDSVRCCVVTRKLTEQEVKTIKGHDQLTPNQSLIATDAIALVVNKANTDSLITLDEIRGIVSGHITRWEQLHSHTRSGELKLVFDNSRSSTVRFMRDSLCGGKQITGNVYASDGGTNVSVLEMVRRDPDMIGVVGANWLMGDSETALSDFSVLDVNVMRVSRKAGDEAKYVRPYQYYIATGDYPLWRSVYVIHTDPRSQSMLRSFYYFLKGQKGQTIICNGSQMLPNSPVQIKAVDVK